MSRFVRVLKRSALLLLLVLVVLAAVVGWLVSTQSGLQAGVALSRSVMPEGITFESIEGQLIGPLNLRGLKLETEAATAFVEHAQLDWRPRRLVDNLVQLDFLTVSGVRVQLLETPADDSAEPIALPERLALPVDLQLDGLMVEDVVVRSGETEFLVDRVSAEAQWLDLAFTLKELNVTAPLADLTMSGAVETAGDYPLKLRLETTLKQEFAVPVLGTVSLSAIGPLSELKITGSAEVAGETVPELTATYSANVKTHAAQLNNYAFTANLAISGQDIDPARYVERLPGNVALAVWVDVAQRQGEDPSVTVSKLSATGELVGEKFAVTGSGSLLEGGGVVKGLQGQWGTYDLSANGTVGTDSNLAWTLGLPDLARVGALVGEDWKGSLTARGQVLGTLEAPRVLVTASAGDLVAQGTAVKAAELEADLSWGGELKLDLLLKDVRVADEQVDELTLKLSGTQANHQLALVIDSSRAEAMLGANGAWQDNNVWAFELAELMLLHPDLNRSRPDHRWQLTAPAKGKVAAGEFSLSELCLAHVLPDDGGEVCVDARLHNETLTAHLALKELGLANLNGVLPSDTRIAGVVSGSTDWTGDVAQTQAALTLEGIRLSVRQGSDWLEVAEFAPGTLGVSPSDDTSGALQIAVNLPLRGDNTNGVFAALRVSPAAVTNASQDELSGTVRAALPDLGWLAAFSEQVDELSGSLVSNVTVSGALASPVLTGITELALPVVKIAELDLVLRNTKLILEGAPHGLLLSGTSRSGEGTIALSSEVRWQDELEVQGTLTGDSFTVSDSTDARVTVSPNLQASYSKQTLILRGDVVVPVAKITLDKVPDGAVTASRDQRFPAEEQANAPIATDVRVRLVLGDEVSFEGLGLNASFGGALSIRDRTEQATTATGEIDVIEGTYKAYGQNLSIKNGKLVFAGGPIEEPGLNVRAVRQATPEIEVGVHVQGSLLQPTLDVFSSPTLPQSDQLAYLVLGRPLSASSASENSVLQQAAMALGVEGGQLLTDRIGESLGVDTFGIESAPGTSNAQAALVVGKYLSPKLYVSYGYGLFEPISTLRLEYQLGRLWRVVTESTNVATGGDFLWVYER